MLPRLPSTSNDRMKVGIKWIITSVSLLCLALIVSAGYFALKSGGPAPDPFRKGADVAIQESLHIDVGQSHDSYSSNPPTSGPHYSRATIASLKDKENPSDEAMLGLVQDGYVWISYNPDKIDDASLNSLEGIPQEAREQMGAQGSRIVVSPRPQDDTPIAISGWGKLMKLQGFSPELMDNEVHAFIASIKQNPQLKPDQG
jgi:hypothetical protein